MSKKKKDSVSNAAGTLGHLGGNKRKAVLSAARRSEIARQGQKAQQAKRGK